MVSHTLTLWTNDPTRAAWADAAGVDRIGLDIETHGKAERQSGLATWISPHRIEDLPALKRSIKTAALFVRSNGLHDGSADEVERLLDAGVEVLMFPNFTTLCEVERFVAIVRDRAKIVPLVEKKKAIALISELPALDVEEIHVGLNDLSIDLGFCNRLAVLASPEMQAIADAARSAKLRLGVGGLGRALDLELPVPADLIYAQHARLGSTGALLARSFFTDHMNAESFAREIVRLRARLDHWREATGAELEAARLALLDSVAEAATP